MVDVNSDDDNVSEESDIAHLNKTFKENAGEEVSSDSDSFDIDDGSEDVELDRIDPVPKAQKQPEEKRPEPRKAEKAVDKKPVQKPVLKTEHKTVHKPANATQKQPEAKKPIHKEIKEVKKIQFKPKIIHKKIETQKYKPRVQTMKNKKEPKSLAWLWITIAVVIVVVAAVFIIKNSGVTAPKNITENAIAATVNGEPIYLKDIDSQYNQLSPAVQQTYSKEAVLNQTIEEVLLLQEAKAENIQVASADIDQELTIFKQQNQLTDQQLSDILVQQNVTIVQLRDMIEKKLAVKNLLNATILSNITVSNQSIKDYYDANLGQFKSPASVTVSHILILIKDNVTDAVAKDKIDNISSQLTSTNFCDLVKKYTEDTASQNTCGTYTFGRGEMVPEFENASFNLGINQTTIVKTVYGYHLIKKLAASDAGTMTFEAAYATIQTKLHDEMAQKNFDAFLESLRSKAKIVNYMVKQIDPTNTVTNAPVNTVINTNIETVNNATDTNTTQETLPVVSNVNLDDFAKCLTDKGVKMYGAYWCPHCQNQKEMFGTSIQYLTYVECAVKDNPQVQTPECTAAGISGYPTWMINDKSYAGEQTLKDLARLSGCTLPQ